MNKQAVDEKNKFFRMKNPWNFRKDVVVLDIETEKFEGRPSFEEKSGLKFLCGIIYDYNTGKYRRFTDPIKLVKKLKTADTVVTFNGENFDFIVLAKYGVKLTSRIGKAKPLNLKSLDIFACIIENRAEKYKNAKYPSLADLMKSHYNKRKKNYNHENAEELIKHCLDDVKYTKKLYEEKVWRVPIISLRDFVPRCYYYEKDDEDGVMWDGERWIGIADFGQPIAYLEHFNKVPSPEVSCPLCKNILNITQVYQMKTSSVHCSKCEAVITFQGPTPFILERKTKEEYEKNRCSNCEKRFELHGYAHYGYGAGEGYQSSGMELCTICQKGCYEWEKDDTPGFRDSSSTECCNCGAKNDI